MHCFSLIRPLERTSSTLSDKGFFMVSNPATGTSGNTVQVWCALQGAFASPSPKMSEVVFFHIFSVFFYVDATCHVFIKTRGLLGAFVVKLRTSGAQREARETSAVGLSNTLH